MDIATGVANPCPDAVQGVSAHLFLTLVNTLMAAKCQITSPQNYPRDSSPNLKDQDEFDFIVIGAGSAGSVVANKLSENPDWKVLILEAGNVPSANSEIPSLLFSLQGTSEDWQYTTEVSDKACLGLKGKACAWPRGKCLGGSSSINANLYVRGNRRDFDKWAEEGNEGWDYDSVLKHFRELEDLQVEELDDPTQYGRGGYLPLTVYHSDEPIKKAIEESGQVLGYPTVTQEQNLGYFDALQTVEKGVRANAAKAFLGKVKDRSNLIVAINSHVEKIIIDQKKAKGVEINVGGKKITVKARKEVILSAGAVNSPQILMLSGVGPKDHLQSLGIEVVQDLAVGQNLQDHIMFAGIYTAFADEAVHAKHQASAVDDLYQYFMYQQGKVSQIGITNLVGFVNTGNDSIYPNVQLHHVLFDKNDRYLLPEIIKVVGIADEISAIMLQINKKSPTVWILPTLLNPKSRGEIILRSNNPLDKPRIFARYLEHPDDVETILGGVKHILRQFETEPFKKLNPEVIDVQFPGCEKFEFKSDDFWRCGIRRLTVPVYHPVGTCKMGVSTDSEAVVDSKLRVHGIENLRVIDASIMPKIPSANTNAATLMIGRKGGSMIVDEWSGKHDEL